MTGPTVKQVFHLPTAAFVSMLISLPCVNLSDDCSSLWIILASPCHRILILEQSTALCWWMTGSCMCTVATRHAILLSML